MFLVFAHLASIHPLFAGCDPKDLAKGVAAHLVRRPASVEAAMAFSNVPVRTLLEWSFKNKRPVTMTRDGGIVTFQALEFPRPEECRITFFGRGLGLDGALDATELAEISVRGAYGSAVPELFARSVPDRNVLLILTSGQAVSGRILGYDARGNVHWLPDGAEKPTYLPRSKINLEKTVDGMRRVPVERYSDSEVVLGGGVERRVDGQTKTGAFSLSTDLGKGRKYVENQDAGFVFEKDGAVYLGVVDGAGGMGDGRRASQIIAQKTVESIRSGATDVHNTVFENASIALRAAVARGEIGSKASGTAGTVRIFENRVRTAHVGDVKIGLVHGDDITTTFDHSVVHEKVERGEISPLQALYDPKNNVVTRAISKNEFFADMSILDIQKGDWIVLASDGFWDHVIPGDLPPLLKSAKTVQEAQEILQRVFSHGLPGRPNPDDNVTILVYRHER